MVLRLAPCRCTLPPDPEARYQRPDPEWVCRDCENTGRVLVPTTYRPLIQQQALRAALAVASRELGVQMALVADLRGQLADLQAMIRVAS